MQCNTLVCGSLWCIWIDIHLALLVDLKFHLSRKFLNFLSERHADSAQRLPHGFKDWIAEGTDARRVELAQALDFHQVTFDAGDYSPYVAEGQASKEESPDQGQRKTQDGRENPVTPIFGDGEGSAAGFPHSIEAVNAVRFSKDIFKVHLKRKKYFRLLCNRITQTGIN